MAQKLGYSLPLGDKEGCRNFEIINIPIFMADSYSPKKRKHHFDLDLERMISP